MEKKENEVCKFGDLEPHAFFEYEGITLCKFGIYGLGVGPDGNTFKVLSDDIMVLKVNPFKKA